MKNITDLEIINISTVNGKLKALLSYRDITVDDLNNGYNTIEIPINIREIQYGAHDCMLVDQSIKYESSPQVNDPHPFRDVGFD